jgi:acetyl-CoA carboxylase carboxyl transferase subunit alpha
VVDPIETATGTVEPQAPEPIPPTAVVPPPAAEPAEPAVPAPDVPPPPAPAVTGDAAKARTWSRVQLARNLRRPRILDLVGAMAEEFIELHGDRLFGDDEAVVAGLARIGERRVVVVGQQKGADTEENIRRNFGMPHPEGYRKAMRIMELAERFGLPIVTFVDVPGAHPGPESEERGIAEAIARSIGLMSRLRTPIVVVITGEGGSGGALAIAVGDVVIALENAVYSVISPEGCASILWRTADEAPTAAVAMRMTAPEQQALGVIDIVVAEPGAGAHTDHAETARRLKTVIIEQLDALGDLSLDALVEARYRRFRTLGAFREVESSAPPQPERPGLADRLRNLLDPGRWSGVPSNPGGRRDEPPARDEV